MHYAIPEEWKWTFQTKVYVATALVLVMSGLSFFVLSVQSLRFPCNLCIFHAILVFDGVCWVARVLAMKGVGHAGRNTPAPNPTRAHSLVSRRCGQLAVCFDGTDGCPLLGCRSRPHAKLSLKPSYPVLASRCHRAAAGLALAGTALQIQQNAQLSWDCAAVSS